MTKRPRSAAVDISSFDDFLDTLAPSTSTSSSSTTTAGGMTTDSIAKLLHHNNSSSSSGEQSQSQQRPPLQQGEDPFLQRRRQPQRILGSSSSGSSAGTQRRRLPFGAAAAVAAPPTEPLTVEQQQAQVASEDLAAAFLAEGLRANAVLTESDMKINWEAAITSELAEHGCIGVRELYLNEGIADVAAWDLPLLSMPMYRFTAAPNSNKNNAVVEEDGEREVGVAAPTRTTTTMLQAHLQAHQLPSQTFTGLKKDVALDLLQMPVLPMNPLLRDEFLFLDNQRVTVKLVKTPEELRAERRQKLLEKQQQQRLEKQKQQLQEGGSSEETVVHTLSSLHQDRLNYRNLLDDKMSVLSSISPIAAENLIVQQKQERLIEHHRQNYDRHVAALPQQILKREADMWRHAEEDPQLCVYVVPSVKNADCVHRIRNFANDGCLRGFVLWVQDPRTAHHNGMTDSHVPPTASSGKDSAASSSAERHVPGDVIIVLAGGRTAMRHLHRWITEKMRWHGATAEDASRSAIKSEDASSDLIATSQRGRLVGSIRLLRVGDVSFLLPRPTETTAMEFLLPSRRLSRKQEHVFVRVAESWKDASSFLREQMPAASQYADLRFAWQNLFGLV